MKVAVFVGLLALGFAKVQDQVTVCGVSVSAGSAATKLDGSGESVQTWHAVPSDGCPVAGTTDATAKFDCCAAANYSPGNVALKKEPCSRPVANTKKVGETVTRNGPTSAQLFICKYFRMTGSSALVQKSEKKETGAGLDWCGVNVASGSAKLCKDGSMKSCQKWIRNTNGCKGVEGTKGQSIEYKCCKSTDAKTNPKTKLKECEKPSGKKTAEVGSKIEKGRSQECSYVLLTGTKA